MYLKGLPRSIMDPNEVVQQEETTVVEPITPETFQARITELETQLTQAVADRDAADQLLAEIDNAQPEPSAYKLANTNPHKVPFVSGELRPAFAKWLVPIIVKNLDQFYKGNGANTTIGQDALIFNNPDGSSLKASLSLNHWEPTSRTAKGKTADNTPETYAISPTEFGILDAAIAKAEAAKDTPVQVRLATIKAVAKAMGNRLGFDDLVLVKQLAKR